MNSRHPDPRRVWKVGSGARLLPPLPRDPVDSLDPVDPVMRSETSIFDNPSGTFGHFARKMFPQSGPKRFLQLEKSLPVYAKRLLGYEVLGQGKVPKGLPWSQNVDSIEQNRRFSSPFSGRARKLPAGFQFFCSLDGPWPPPAGRPARPPSRPARAPLAARQPSPAAPSRPPAAPRAPPGRPIYVNSRSPARRPLC